MAKCKAWREGDFGITPYAYDRCYATKEAEICECLGNEAFCDFYPEKRKAATQPKFGEWLRVKDEPPPNKFVFAWCTLTQSVEIAKYKGTLWRTQESRRALNADWITHWMPLPEAPKED